jgi:DNA replication protein DnaC
MNLIELQGALRQLRLGGMAGVLETRLRQAQAEPMAPIDLLSTLVSDELTRRSDRLLERRRKHAGFRDPNKTLDNFDFAFNPKMNRSLVFDLATGAFIDRREDGKLPQTAAEDLLEIIMRRYERASTLLTSNRPVDDWGKLLADVAAVSAMLDRLLHHGHVLKCGPRSWRTKTAAAG